MSDKTKDLEVITNILNRYEYPEGLIREYLTGKGVVIGGLWCAEDVTCILEDMDDAPDLSNDEKLDILEKCQSSVGYISHEAISDTITALY